MEWLKKFFVGEDGKVSWTKIGLLLVSIIWTLDETGALAEVAKSWVTVAYAVSFVIGGAGLRDILGEIKAALESRRQ